MNNFQDKEINIVLNKRISLKKDFPPSDHKKWKQKVVDDLKGVPFEKKLITKTYEGINLKPIYTKEDITDINFITSYPGTENFVRGTNTAGYFQRDWLITQKFPYGDAEDFNSALLHDIERGLTGIKIHLDKPTKLGLDSDYVETDSVGKDGLAISALKSITRALSGINLENYPLTIDTGFSVLPFLIIFEAFLKNSQIDISKIKGNIYSDIISFLIKEGTLPVTLDHAFSEMYTAVKWASEKSPQIKAIGINAHIYHNAGGSAVQELAFAAATGVEYINRMLEKGLNINQISRSIYFSFGIGSFYFLEISKLRAARILWDNILTAYGAEVDNRKMYIHAQTSYFNHTYYDAYVNMLRTTTQTFSAIVGGADSIQTNSFTDALGKPTEFARRISRNSQIILKEESHLNRVIDPAGGSYYVETLTNEIANSAWSLFQKIDKMGGMIKAVKEGFPQKEIEETFSKRAADTRKRKNVIVGTNMFSNLTEQPPEIFSKDQKAFAKKRADYLQKYRVAGSNSKHISILEKLEAISDIKNEALIPTAVDAVIEGATIGEISKAIRSGSESSVKVKPISIRRAAEEFEQIRKSVDKFTRGKNCRPSVFLVTMGSVKQFKARADFAAELFSVGGFDVIYNAGFSDTESAVSAALKAEADLYVICSADENYPGIVPGIAAGIKSVKNDALLVLAGYPKDQIEEHEKSGIYHFIYLGCDVYELLNLILKKMGVIK